MGIAIAEEAARLGAAVTLVLGPVAIRPSHYNITTIAVKTAAEMKEASVRVFRRCDIGILAAAVADFTPETPSDKKIRRGEGEMTIKLTPTEDIAACLGSMKKENQILAGFALETDNEISNAKAKLKKKNLDLIILNSLRDEGAGFGHDTNRITIIDSNNNIDKFELKSKDEVASDIMEKIISLIR
jgi:phosphopantothenoylcysteine decarboxylase/phosphopantothenate--cysteine ligase